jgi:hypothetical protein
MYPDEPRVGVGVVVFRAPHDSRNPEVGSRARCEAAHWMHSAIAAPPVCSQHTACMKPNQGLPGMCSSQAAHVARETAWHSLPGIAAAAADQFPAEF